MKKFIAAALLVSTATLGMSLGATSADAAQGCGRGGHRGPAGHCRANGVVVAPGLVIGNYYHGRGYWDGRRYYQHRNRWHGGWRYR